MLVEELIIDGFKSYAARTVISSWDPQFNAITGLNGSGKSNILDAICFVLGIQANSTVRAANLQDLIYKRGQAGVAKATVTIVFDNTDKSKSPIGMENSPRVSITRQVSMASGSKFLINGHRAQQNQVLNLFQSVQLNINNPTFLIMQGKITKLLNMKPTEILALIEEAAGTKMYEGQRTKAEKTMAKKNLKLDSTRALLEEEVEPKLEQLRNQKRVFIEYQDTQKELETLVQAVTAHEYQQFTDVLKNFSARKQIAETNYEQSKTLVQTLTNEIASLEEDLERMKLEKQQQLEKGNTLKELEKSETELNNEITRLNTTKEIKTQSLKDEIKRLKEIESLIHSLSESITNSDERFKEVETLYNTAKTALEDEKQNLNKKEELLSTLSTGISSKGSTDGGYLSHLQEAKKNLNNVNVKMEKDQLKITHLNKEIEANSSKIANGEKEMKKINAVIESHRNQCDALEAKLAEIGFNQERFQELRQKDKTLNQQYIKANNDLNNFKRSNPNFEFYYEKPSSNFDPNSVKGLIGELFNLPESSGKSTAALEVCAGGRIYNVVVDTEVTGSQLLDRGKLRKRVTFIPLNKVSSKVVDSNTLNAAKKIAPNKVELALNLIEYDKENTKAMEYIFGNKLICDDPKTAQSVTFNPQVRTASITLDGDLYDPEGRLSGGSKRNTSSSVLNSFQHYKALKRKVDSIREEMNEVSKELNKLSKLSERTQSIQHELSVAKHQIEIQTNSLNQNPVAKMLQKRDSNIEEINQLTNSNKELLQKAKEYQDEINRIEVDMKEFNRDKGGKLKELKEEIGKLNKSVKALSKEVEIKRQSFENFRVENEQIESDLKMNKDLKIEVESTIRSLQSEINEVANDISSSTIQLNDTRAEIENEKSILLSINEELNEMTKVLNLKRNNLNEANLNFTKVENEYNQMKNNLASYENKIQEIIEEHEWVTDDKMLASVIEQYPNINLEESRNRIDHLSSRSQSMKRKVNPNIMSAIEQHEKHESALKQKIKTIVKDKDKIEETIKKLDDYKRTELMKTYQLVSKDFGDIFADLLPNSYAKLVCTDPSDVTKGLEVKVKLGNVWKESLVELSGGQRSLVALSLILSLLQFKPAPMYILDEVDAALDLSHTQNIGHLIKTRFKGSQFIVVSLKEGMFTNANRLFKVRFQDGTSVVTAT